MVGGLRLSPACSANFLSVSASLSCAWIWALSSTIFLQLSAYCRLTHSMMVVVKAIPEIFSQASTIILRLTVADTYKYVHSAEKHVDGLVSNQI